MAAHLEGRGASVLDMAGLAQRNGAVLSHVRIAPSPEGLHATRIAAGDADLVLACDILMSVGAEAIAKMQEGRTKAVVNTALAMPADFTRNPDLKFPLGSMEQEVRDAVGAESADFIDATKLALGLMGDSIATNLFMVGYAYQKGLLAVSAAAIIRSIELNGAAVESNTKSFRWGRLAAHDLKAVENAARPPAALPAQRPAGTLDEMIAQRVAFLTAYQNAAYAARYEGLVRRVADAERSRAKCFTGLAEAAARYLFKLMAYKDEYEVARLSPTAASTARWRRTAKGEVRSGFTSRRPPSPPAPPRLAISRSATTVRG